MEDVWVISFFQILEDYFLGFESFLLVSFGMILI